MSTADSMRHSRPAEVRTASMQPLRRCAVRIDRRKIHDASMLPQFLERVKFGQPTPAAPDADELSGKWLNGLSAFRRRDGRSPFPPGSHCPYLLPVTGNPVSHF
jgi:hypothetical protein